MRIVAKVVHDSRREARAKMMEENPTLGQMYNVDAGLMEVLFFNLIEIHSTLFPSRKC